MMNDLYDPYPLLEPDPVALLDVVHAHNQYDPVHVPLVLDSQSSPMVPGSIEMSIYENEWQ